MLKMALLDCAINDNVAVLTEDGAFANFALPGGRVFVNPGANPELLTSTRFPISI